MDKFGSISQVPERPHRLAQLWGAIKALQLNYSRAFGVSNFDLSDLPHGFMPCMNRRLVKTKLGYLGLAPRQAQIGDAAVLLADSEAPLVLRKSGDRYRLVGDCYIHGLTEWNLRDEKR